MASHDVFISYPSADKAAADGVCHGLEARGIRCWMAPRDVIPGSDWQTSLLDAISDARVVVLLFTENANSSEHIKREITAAFEGGAVVIPFRMENVTPKGALRYHLTGVHWLDAFAGEITPHVEQLAETIKRVLQQGQTGEGQTPGVVTVPPLAVAAAPEEPLPSATPAAASALAAGAGASVAAAATVPAAAPASPPTSGTTAVGASGSTAAGAAKPAAPMTGSAASGKPTPTPGAGSRPATAQAPAKAGGSSLPAGVKPWMVAAGAGGLILLLVVALLVWASSGSGGPQPPQAGSAVSGVQIDLNSRPTPPPGEPLQTLPDQPAAAPPAEPQAQTEYVEEDPAPEAPVEETYYEEEPASGEPAQDGAKSE